MSLFPPEPGGSGKTKPEDLLENVKNRHWEVTHSDYIKESVSSTAHELRFEKFHIINSADAENEAWKVSWL